MSADPLEEREFLLQSIRDLDEEFAAGDLDETDYRTLRDEGERRILPLVMDLANPSPGLGWRGAERPAPEDTDVALTLHHQNEEDA